MADVVGDGTLAGVRRWPDAPPLERLELDAQALGWRTAVLDTTGLRTKAEVMQAFADAFALPDWFGMNWDALEECLVDLDLEEVPTTGGVVVAWTGWGSFASAAPKQFAVAVDVFGSAVRQWSAAGVRGSVLLVGAGPEVDVPTLERPPKALG
jgi:hypothetical protein